MSSVQYLPMKQANKQKYATQQIRLRGAYVCEWEFFLIFATTVSPYLAIVELYNRLGRNQF